jgi:hypothetical protein
MVYLLNSSTLLQFLLLSQREICRLELGNTRLEKCLRKFNFELYTFKSNNSLCEKNCFYLK